MTTGSAVSVTPSEFHDAPSVGDWRVVGDGVAACFATASFAAAARLIAAIDALGVEDHRPDIDLRDGAVVVKLFTLSDDGLGMTGRDVELARRISEEAARLECVADPWRVQSVMVTIDAMVSADVMPFWRAVLGYEYRRDSPDDLVDPLGRGVPIWFQEMDAPRPQRNTIHVDVWVAHDRAEARVAAALAAGGVLVSDTHAPQWWTLADAEGNEVDVATWVGRD